MLPLVEMTAARWCLGLLAELAQRGIKAAVFEGAERQS